MNALPLCRWQFSHKETCSRLSLSEVRFRTENGRFAFLCPLIKGLGATYDVHLRLVGKRVVDFLLVLIEVFARCYYRWGATREYRLKIGDFAPTRSVWPKISGRRGHPHQPFFFSKIRLNGLSYDIKIWTDLSSVLSQSTRLTDRRTDRQTLF